MALIEIEFPDEDAVFVAELLERFPCVRTLPPATEAEATERQRIAEFRQRLCHSYGKDPLASRVPHSQILKRWLLCYCSWSRMKRPTFTCFSS